MADGGAPSTKAIDIHRVATALGQTKRGALKRADREAWAYETRRVSGGAKRFYAFDCLPADVREAIQRAQAIEAAAIAPASEHFQAGAAVARRQLVVESVDQAVRQRAFETGASDAAGLMGKRRSRMDAKVDLLQRLAAFARARGLGICKAMDDFCAAYNSGALPVPPSIREHAGADLHPATVRRWRALHQKHGPAALAGNYGNRAGSSKLDTNAALRDFVVGLLADKPHISAKLVSEALDARFGATDADLPDERSVQRWLKKWKTDNAETFLALTNPDAWKNRHMAAFGSLTEGITRACQLWQLDSTPADLQLVDGRYSLVGVIDLAWRGLRLHVTKTSTADAVCQVMRRAIIEWGVPEAIKCDNGRDYASDRVALLLTSLHIESRFSAPFAPWEKGNIERAFRSFSHSLLEMLPGYSGHNVAEAQELRARKAFADRLFKKNEVVELKLTSAELQEFCDRWCRDYYAHQPHEGLAGATPFERYAQLRDVVRRIGDVRALDLLLGEGDLRTVTKKGLRIDRLTYIAPELATVVGQQVLVRRDDNADLGQVVVYHNERFLCVADCPEVAGVSRREIAIESKARQAAQIQEAKRQLTTAKRKAKTQDIAWEILDRKAAQNASLSTLPAPNVTHLTPALEAASEAADALDGATAIVVPLRPADFIATRDSIRSEQAQDETAEQRFKRALDLLLRPESERNDFERHFLRSHMQSSEFRARWQMFEDFGAGTFGLGDDYLVLLPSGAFYHRLNEAIQQGTF